MIFRCGEASRCPLFLRLRWCETALDHRKSGAIGQVVAGVISDGELEACQGDIMKHDCGGDSEPCQTLHLEDSVLQ